MNLIDQLKRKYQTAVNTFGAVKNQRANEQMMSQDKGVYESPNNLYNKAGNAVLNTNQKSPVPLYDLASAQKIPIPPKESDLIKQQINPQIEERRLALEKYPTNYGESIPQPPEEYANYMWEAFPNDATRSAVVAGSENAPYNPEDTNVNKDGSVDYGLFQINDKTFEDMLTKSKYRQQLEELGINTLEDLKDPYKNVMAAAVVKQYEEDAGAGDWDWWYGWQNKGIDLKK